MYVCEHKPCMCEHESYMCMLTHSWPPSPPQADREVRQLEQLRARQASRGAELKAVAGEQAAAVAALQQQLGQAKADMEEGAARVDRARSQVVEAQVSEEGRGGVIGRGGGGRVYKGVRRGLDGEGLKMVVPGIGGGGGGNER